MPCVRPHSRQPRRFLPHFPPGSMRCQFSPELVPTLPHAMITVFPKTDCGSKSGSSTTFSPLIPKPSGEVSRVGRGGYTLKTVLEQEHEWENGLYNKIRVLTEPLCSQWDYQAHPFQERVCSLAEEYLDTSLAYSAQSGNSKTRLTLICELVRFFSNHTSVHFIMANRLPMNFQYYSSLKIAGSYMIYYAST
jgi:hypothetical protein